MPVVADCRERVGIVTPFHSADDVDSSAVKIEAPEICAVLLMTALPLSSRTRGRCEVQGQQAHVVPVHPRAYQPALGSLLRTDWEGNKWWTSIGFMRW